MEKLILEIKVFVDQVHSVNSSEGNSATMINFHGSVESEIFTGKILSGGVDTQRWIGGKGTLSARYMLEGVDAENAPCHIFIENNGAFPQNPKDEIITKPIFLTDSPNLKWLESAQDIYGKVKDCKEYLMIKFFEGEKCTN